MNLGFETAGPRAGSASEWHIRSRSLGSQVAAFFDGPNAVAIASPTTLDSVDWTPSQTTVTANAATAPDGTVTADQIWDTAAAGPHVLSNVSVNLDDAKRYTFGCYFLYGDGLLAVVRLPVTAGSVYAVADLQTGRLVEVSPVAGEVSGLVAECVVQTNGWCRLSISVSLGAPLTTTPQLALSDGTSLGFTGLGTQYLFAWGAFLFEGDLKDREDFGGAWSNDTYLFVHTSLTAAQYVNSTVNPNDFEDFETAWSNTGFLSALSSTTSAVYDATPEAFEDMEDDWLASPFETTLSSTTVALFGGVGVERFEDGWLADPYITALGLTTTMQFDGPVAEAVEDFEEVLLDLAYTVDPGTNLFTSLAHGLSAGAVLYPRNVGGDLPAPLNITVPVFVISPATDTFKVSLTSGGAEIDITTAGSGQQSFRGDPARYWNSDGYNATL